MRSYFRVMQDNFNEMDFKTIQNTREDLIGEIDAIVQYANHYRATDKQIAKETIKDILEEEMVHVGELMGLLFELEPIFKQKYEEGLTEFNERKKK